jgi:hypothetical protein
MTRIFAIRSKFAAIPNLDRYARMALVPLCALALAIIASTSCLASAANIYIAQGGNGSGSSCSSPLPDTFFNNAGNWGSGPAQIGPGTVVTYCGAGTYPAGSTALSFQGNGASGSPITLLFAAGASLSSPYFAGSPNYGCGGAICMSSYGTGRSFVTVDGGSNGAIINTANGDGLGNQQGSEGIEMTNCNTCTVQNIAITNMYVHIQNGVTHAQGLDQTQERAISMQGSNLTVNNARMVNCGWCLFNPYVNGDTNITIENSYFQYYDHGWALTGCAGCSFTNAYYHDNQQLDTANWDTSGCDFHHDGIHTFGSLPDGSSSISNFNVYNNYWGGNWGNCATGFIFIERGASTPTGMKTFNGWNNVAVVSPQTSVDTNSWWGLFEASTLRWYNNTITGANATDNTLCTSVQYTGAVYYENNVTNSCGDPVETDNSTIVTWDYNAYGTSCQNGMNCFGYDGNLTSSFSAWKTACACDAHSFQNNSLSLNSDGSISGNSPVLGVGTSLSSSATGTFASLADNTSEGNKITPTVRTASWPIGAFGTGGSAPAPPAGGGSPTAPTGLSISVQ